MSELELRPAREEERALLHDLPLRLFHASDAEAAAERETEGPHVSLERSRVLVDDGQVVASSYLLPLRMGVPGATTPVAGLTYAGVASTHRRRGLLTRLMEAHLRGVADDGEPLLALHASESAIYGRFGFGLGTRRLAVEVRRGETAFRRPVPPPAQVRLDEAPALRADLERVWAATWPSRPGALDRAAAGRWDVRLGDPPAVREGATARQAVVVADGDRGPRGYALYRVRSEWDDSLPRAVCTVEEVVALDAAAAAGVWQLLLDLDLVGTWRASSLAPDDPLPHLLADPRRARPRLGDALWVRLVRVGDALALRELGAEADVVLDVADPRLPDNAPRWHLRGAPGSATTCEPTTRAADVALDVRDLASAYLGGTSLVELAGAGLVEERTPGALVRASRALSWHVAPWCQEVF